MALVHWEPSAGLTALRREMDRLFEDFVKRPLHLGDLGAWAPAVEVADTKDTVVVKAQVPGISKEQLQVQVTDDSLTLKGEMKEEEKQEEKHYVRREFHYGAFLRTIALPAAVQVDKVQAQLKDGVLEITLPKSAKAQAKEIAIQT
ncbi:MAG TPA: Hsp20/alpha crystallin family protein [Candidatus Tectomicrobia bacterium]|jgi:HSP20 family protein